MIVNILITGATGFVGRNLVAALLERQPEDRLSAFLLPNEAMPETFKGRVGIERGDLRDAESVRKAIKGKDVVFHVAGYISYWKLDSAKLEAINVEGTRAVVDACIEFGVERLVHVSSVGAIGFNAQGTPANERTAFNWPESFGYMTTKRDGQQVVERAVRERGLDAVIVNPASVMGPGDPLPDSAHNRLYKTMFKAPLFVGTFGGGLAVVDVRDLVETIIAAEKRGRKGERYLAVGANVPYSKVLSLMAFNANKRFIPMTIPTFALVAAGWCAETISLMTRKRPLLTIAYGKLSGWVAYYSNEKCVSELGVAFRPLEQTIRDGCSYYEERFIQPEERDA